ALSKVGVAGRAARIAKTARSKAFELKKNDPTFAEAWNDALDEASDHLEEEMIRRATTGSLKPVYHGGELVGHIREYSDTLLIFTLKGARPEKYRERFEHSGKIQTEDVTDPAARDARALELVNAALARKAAAESAEAMAGGGDSSSSDDEGGAVQ